MFILINLSPAAATHPAETWIAVGIVFIAVVGVAYAIFRAATGKSGCAGCKGCDQPKRPCG